MNSLSWILAFSVLVLLMAEAVNFHKATICRQEAWLKSTEMKTRSLLSNPPERDQDWHFRCRLHIRRTKEEISWQRLPSPTRHPFPLPLKGEL